MKRHKLYLLVLVALVVFSSCGSTITTKTTETYYWNNGHCEVCGGELIWQTTGSKEHYKCKICGKEYTFDGVKKKK